MSDFLEVPRRDKWRKRCQRKFRRRRYRTWTCYRPPLRKTNGGASRRSEREREREREYKTTSVFCCVREMRETIGLFIERERERECVLYGATGISLSLSVSAAAYSVLFLSFFFVSFCFPPHLCEIIIISLLFVFLGGVAFCLLLFLNFFLPNY